MITIFKIHFGAAGHVDEQSLYFRPEHECDAIVRFSEVVLKMDGNPDIHCAFAHFSRMPDSVHPEGLTLASWTKTSDERPTERGALSYHAALGSSDLDDLDDLLRTLDHAGYGESMSTFRRAAIAIRALRKQP